MDAHSSMSSKNKPVESDELVWTAQQYPVYSQVLITGRDQDSSTQLVYSKL